MRQPRRRVSGTDEKDERANTGSDPQWLTALGRQVLRRKETNSRTMHPDRLNIDRQMTLNGDDARDALSDWWLNVSP